VIKNNTPLVSVIVNCFNGERYLKEAIESVYAQSYDNWEIIFWDNASTDGSAKIAKSYDKKLKYFLAEKTVCLGEARNLAMEKASGKFISFLDCDDVYLQDKIKTQLNAMIFNNVVLSYGSWIEIDEAGNEVKKHPINKYFGNGFEKLLSRYDVNFQTLMIQKDFIEKNKIYFDKNLTFSPDFNVVLQISYACSNIMALSEFMIKYRIHDASMSHNKKEEKYLDYDYIMRSFISQGVLKERPDFYQKMLFNRYKIRVIDSMSIKSYLKVMLYSVKYAFFLVIYKITGKRIKEYYT
jgi:glycosyltransferase involved in cell wall biosynthesis